MAFYDGSQRAIEANDMTFAQVSKMCKADEITIRFTNHHLGLGSRRYFGHHVQTLTNEV